MRATIAHDAAAVRAETWNLVAESKAQPVEVDMRAMTTRSSAGFAGATGCWGRVWEGAVEAPSHELEAIVESAGTGRAIEVRRE